MHTQTKVRSGSLKSAYQLTIYTQLAVFIYDSETRYKYESKNRKQLETIFLWNTKTLPSKDHFQEIFLHLMYNTNDVLYLNLQPFNLSVIVIILSFILCNLFEVLQMLRVQMLRNINFGLLAAAYISQMGALEDGKANQGCSYPAIIPLSLQSYFKFSQFSSVYLKRCQTETTMSHSRPCGNSGNCKTQLQDLILTS